MLELPRAPPSAQTPESPTKEWKCGLLAYRISEGVDSCFHLFTGLQDFRGCRQLLSHTCACLCVCVCVCVCVCALMCVGALWPVHCVYTLVQICKTVSKPRTKIFPPTCACAPVQSHIPVLHATHHLPVRAALLCSSNWTRCKTQLTICLCPISLCKTQLTVCLCVLRSCAAPIGPAASAGPVSS